MCIRDSAYHGHDQAEATARSKTAASARGTAELEAAAAKKALADLANSPGGAKREDARQALARHQSLHDQAVSAEESAEKRYRDLVGAGRDSILTAKRKEEEAAADKAKLDTTTGELQSAEADLVAAESKNAVALEEQAEDREGKARQELAVADQAWRHAKQREDDASEKLSESQRAEQESKRREAAADEVHKSAILEAKRAQEQLVEARSKAETSARSLDQLEAQLDHARLELQSSNMRAQEASLEAQAAVVKAAAFKQSLQSIVDTTAEKLVHKKRALAIVAGLRRQNQLRVVQARRDALDTAAQAEQKVANQAALNSANIKDISGERVASLKELLGATIQQEADALERSEDNKAEFERQIHDLTQEELAAKRELKAARDEEAHAYNAAMAKEKKIEDAKQRLIDAANHRKQKLAQLEEEASAAIGEKKSGVEEAEASALIAENAARKAEGQPLLVHIQQLGSESDKAGPVDEAKMGPEAKALREEAGQAAAELQGARAQLDSTREAFDEEVAQLENQQPPPSQTGDCNRNNGGCGSMGPAAFADAAMLWRTTKPRVITPEERLATQRKRLAMQKYKRLVRDRTELQENVMKLNSMILAQRKRKAGAQEALDRTGTDIQSVAKQVADAEATGSELTKARVAAAKSSLEAAETKLREMDADAESSMQRAISSEEQAARASVKAAKAEADSMTAIEAQLSQVANRTALTQAERASTVRLLDRDLGEARGEHSADLAEVDRLQTQQVVEARNVSRAESALQRSQIALDRDSELLADRSKEEHTAEAALQAIDDERSGKQQEQTAASQELERAKLEVSEDGKAAKAAKERQHKTESQLTELERVWLRSRSAADEQDQAASKATQDAAEAKADAKAAERKSAQEGLRLQATKEHQERVRAEAARVATEAANVAAAAGDKAKLFSGEEAGAIEAASRAEEVYRDASLLVEQDTRKLEAAQAAQRERDAEVLGAEEFVEATKKAQKSAELDLRLAGQLVSKRQAEEEKRRRETVVDQNVLGAAKASTAATVAKAREAADARRDAEVEVAKTVASLAGSDTALKSSIQRSSQADAELATSEKRLSASKDQLQAEQDRLKRDQAAETGLKTKVTGLRHAQAEYLGKLDGIRVDSVEGSVEAAKAREVSAVEGVQVSTNTTQETAQRLDGAKHALALAVEKKKAENLLLGSAERELRLAKEDEVGRQSEKREADSELKGAEQDQARVERAAEQATLKMRDDALLVADQHAEVSRQEIQLAESEAQTRKLVANLEHVREGQQALVSALGQTKAEAELRAQHVARDLARAKAELARKSKTFQDRAQVLKAARKRHASHAEAERAGVAEAEQYEAAEGKEAQDSLDRAADVMASASKQLAQAAEAQKARELEAARAKSANAEAETELAASKAANSQADTTLQRAEDEVGSDSEGRNRRKGDATHTAARLRRVQTERHMKGKTFRQDVQELDQVAKKAAAAAGQETLAMQELAMKQEGASSAAEDEREAAKAAVAASTQLKEELAMVDKAKEDTDALEATSEEAQAERQKASERHKKLAAVVRTKLALMRAQLTTQQAATKVAEENADQAASAAARATAKTRALEAKHAQESEPVSYTHLRAHETPEHLVCRLLLEKKKKKKKIIRHRG
eukprot:TRINITY_DN23010_c0_g1_i2.p1 TRINITY_DN23010_c0_g1~~TRINITY_DN23010_c0_g1_i2.p1  ORF type:complete len:1637 (+),score=605.17 TRINITY_DN23010_c0_g1_i2:205-5115(+)